MDRVQKWWLGETHVQTLNFFGYMKYLQAIGTLNMTTEIRSLLLVILNDTTREASLRTQAFKSLAETTDEELLTALLDILHTDVMDNTRLYMTSYIEAVLESDQPDRKE